MSEARHFLGATGNADFGYFGGGNPSPSYTSLVDRLDYSSDTTTAAAKGSLSAAVNQLTATGSSSFGYFGGGFNPALPGSRSTIDRVDYSNDTAAASPKGPLTATNYSFSAASARANGFVPIGPSVVSNAPVQGHNPFGYGYWYGGIALANPEVNSRIDFSNDTATQVIAGRGSITDPNHVGSTSSQSHGYSWMTAAPNSTHLERLDFANDTASQPAVGNFSVAVQYRSGAAGNKDYGYWFGGHNNYSIIERVDYSNDSATTTTKGPMTANRYATAAVGNQSFGYVGGSGLVGTTVIDRLDYSNDTATALARGNTGTNGGYKGAVGNASFGYFAGGYSPVVSTITRLDYSNDTNNATPKGPLTTAKLQFSGTGNQSFGYFGGGFHPSAPSTYSTTERVDYSNDTATAVAKAPLLAVRRHAGAFSAAENANPQ